MQYEDFISRFNAQVFKLEYDRQLELAISICKKLFFDYQIFTEKYQWGNSDTLLDAIAICEQTKLNPVDKILVEQFLVKVDAITPDMDDYGEDMLGSYVLNACCAVYETLQFLIDQDSKRIYSIGISFTDNVDFKIQENGDMTEQQIDQNPMMIDAAHNI
ncbi:MAG TPA: DUF416 family protein [Ferruginibacter sp.]|nr:DUF416 family protein [Ferruginibacter sp.]